MLASTPSILSSNAARAISARTRFCRKARRGAMRSGGGANTMSANWAIWRPPSRFSRGLAIGPGIEKQELVSREIVVHPIDGVAGSTSGDPLQRVCAVLLASKKPAGHPVQSGDCESILRVPKRSPIWPVAGSTISSDDVDTGLHRGTMTDPHPDLKAYSLGCPFHTGRNIGLLPQLAYVDPLTTLGHQHASRRSTRDGSIAPRAVALGYEPGSVQAVSQFEAMAIDMISPAGFLNRLV